MKNYIVALLLGAIAIIAGCTASETPDTGAADTTETAETAPIVAEDPDTVVGEVKEFTIQSRNWEFIPDEIRVNKGDTVIIHLEGLDDGSGAGHGLAIPAFGVNQEIRDGQTIDVEFTADKTGTFPFVCSVFCGAGHGDMKGKLIVE